MGFVLSLGGAQNLYTASTGKVAAWPLPVAAPQEKAPAPASGRCFFILFSLLRSGRAGPSFLTAERMQGNTSERAQWAMQRGCVGAAVKTGSGDSRARRFWVPQEVPKGNPFDGFPLGTPSLPTKEAVPLWNPTYSHRDRQWDFYRLAVLPPVADTAQPILPGGAYAPPKESTKPELRTRSLLFHLLFHIHLLCAQAARALPF